MKVVLLDVFRSEMLWSKDEMISQVILIEIRNSVFFFQHRVVCENNWKQSNWIYENIYSNSEIEVNYCCSDQLFV